MNGKDICNLLKQYKKELSEKNGIDYKIKDCSHGDDCKGTCPFCEKETDELYALLVENESNGENVDWTTSVELPDESFVLDADKFTDYSFEIRDVINEHISDGLCNDDEFKSKRLFEPDVINVDYLEPLHGDVDYNTIFPNENLSHMNELMGDIVYEPDYPETPYSELCEFFSSFEPSESESSESDKDDKVTIEKIKEVRRRTSRGFADVKEALRKCNGNVDEAVKYLEKHCNKPLMGRIIKD